MKNGREQQRWVTDYVKMGAWVRQYSADIVCGAEQGHLGNTDTNQGLYVM